MNWVYWNTFWSLVVSSIWFMTIVSHPDSVVVDGLSGMTGAGRTLKASTHSGAVLENVTPYRVGAHQHVPEIAQLLGFPVSFTPHLLPVRRGLIATCNVRSTGADLRGLLEEAYAGSPVVTVGAQ
jgi:N-acetyl-gamma-glutamyl-phosphate reductase